jgi:outer membrane protein OmpA-like peptidoglycan-associated protein
VEDDDDKLDEADSQLERHPEQTFPVAVAPSLVGEDEPLNTIRPGLVSVACWRLDDGRFAFDSSFILPAAASDLKRLAALRTDYEDSPVSIFGHADPVGTDAHNKTLSGNRARALHALMIHDLAVWEELFNEHGWGLRSSQLILMDLDARELAAEEKNAAADAASGSAPADGSTKPSTEGRFLGPAEGEDTPAWKKAVERFQVANGLSKDGVAGKNTRKKLYELYMKALLAKKDGSPLFQKTDFLGKGSDAKGKGAFQGCSEFNPIILLSDEENKKIDKGKDPHVTRNARNAPNRRVVLYFFPKGFEIELDKWPCPRASEGSAGCKKRFWSDADKRIKPDPKLTRSYGPIAGEPLLKPQQDTFACRFYDRLARRSPCEAGFNEWIVQLLFPGEETLEKRPRVAGCKFTAVGSAGKTQGVTDENGILRIRARAPDETVKVQIKIPIGEPKRDGQAAAGGSTGNADAASADDKNKDDDAPPETTTVTLVLRGGKLAELDDPAKKNEAIDDRLRTLGFGPLAGKVGNPAPRDDDAKAQAIDDFRTLEGLEEGDDLPKELHDRYGS